MGSTLPIQLSPSTVVREAAVFFDEMDRLAILPGCRSPRLVLADGSPLQRWRESAWLPAYRPVARVWKFLVRLRFLFVGLQGSGVRGAAGPAEPASSTWTRWLEGPRRAVRVGTPDARQKLTVLVFDSNGALCRVAKVGRLPLARILVEREARILRGLPTGLGPSFLWGGDTRNGQVVVFRPVHGAGMPVRLPGAADSREWHAVDAFLERLVVEPHGVAVHEHPDIRRVITAHAPAVDWLSGLAGREWPTVIEHGDLAPWNLLRTADGLRAIDWEDGRLEGFPGFDLVHYVTNVGVLVHHWCALDVSRYARARLRATGFSEAEAQALVRLAALQDYTATETGEQAALQAVRRELFSGAAAPA